MTARYGARSARDRQTLLLAADMLRNATRPVCLAGRGLVWSGGSQALLRLCARLPNLRIASTPTAKGVLSERHPAALGPFGFGGLSRAARAVAEADALVVAGTRLHESSSGGFHERFQRPGVIRIDIDPSHAPRRNGQLLLRGDARAVLEELCNVLGAREPATPSAASSAAPGVKSAIATYEAPIARAGHVKPQVLFSVLSRVAAHVPITADAGMSMCWAIECLERTNPCDFQVSLDWGTMGFALPAAIGIALSRGSGPVIAVTGDGAMAMAGGDLHTAVEQELPVIVVVLNDGGYGMVRAGSEAWFGPGRVPDPMYRHKIDLAGYAKALGARGRAVTSIEHFEHALRGALSSPGPTLLDVQVDPAEVPGAIQQRVTALREAVDGAPATPAESPIGLPHSGVSHGGGMC